MQYFEVHTPVAMHNTTGRAVPLTWLLLHSQSTVDLIANAKMLLNIRKMRVKDAIRVQCNSRVNIVDRVGDLPGYNTLWYEPTGISNIISISSVTKTCRVVFNSKGKNCFRMILTDREVRLQLSPNGLYYFNATDIYNIILILNTVLENRKGFIQRG